MLSGDSMNERKCPKCGAMLKYNSLNGSLECEYCRAKFNLEEFNISNQFNLYMCKNCGAKLISKKQTAVNNCIYCNSQNIEQSVLSSYNADYIIPFKISKNDAINTLKKIYRNKWLKSKEFKSSNLNNVTAIYVPITLYDFDAIGVVEYECSLVSKWLSGGYKYTKCDKYKEIRGGKMTIENMPVASVKEDIVSDVEPFDYKEIKKFDSSLTDLIQIADYTKEELVDKSIKKAKECFENQLKNDIKDYDEISTINNSVNLNKLKAINILVPIWLLIVKYNGQKYKFIVNGQTGKSTGIVPRNLKKTIIIFIITFILTFIILFILNYLKVIS